MNQEYNITCNGHIVGKANVKKEGLYYHFRCICDLRKENIYTIIASCGGTEQNLGICVPMGECLGVDTKIPIKYIGEGEFTFRAVSKQNDEAEAFYSLDAGKPFANLSQLENAHFCIQDNKPGIRIKRLKSNL